MGNDYEQVGQVEQFFGSVEIEGKACGVDGCNEPPAAVFPIRTPDEVGVWWFCEKHATAAMRDVDGLVPREITRTCGVGSDVPCGAAATIVAIVGVRDEKGEAKLDVLSVCDRDGAMLEERFRA
jgi:hypothetical protein